MNRVFQIRVSEVVLSNKFWKIIKNGKNLNKKKKNLRSTYFSYSNLQNSKPGTLKTQSVTKIHLNPHAFSQLEVNGNI